MTFQPWSRKMLLAIYIVVTHQDGVIAFPFVKLPTAWHNRVSPKSSRSTPLPALGKRHVKTVDSPFLGYSPHSCRRMKLFSIRRTTNSLFSSSNSDEEYETRQQQQRQQQQQPEEEAIQDDFSNVKWNLPNWKQDTTSNTDSTASADSSEMELDRDAHVSLLDSNLRRYTNKGLFEHMFGKNNDNSNANNTTYDYHEWDDVHMSMRFSITSHGSINGMDGPINNYANFGACSAYQLQRGQLLDFPAARMASPDGTDQIDWSEFIQALRIQGEQHGPLNKEANIRRYRGNRCSLLDQRKFRIENALVWNCFDQEGKYYGQAVLFDREEADYIN